MLTALLSKAQNSYPSKQIIGKDTVICSTVGQQKKYLEWKTDRDECREISAKQSNTIFLMDSLIKAQNKQITYFQNQTFYFDKLVKKQDESLVLASEKFKIIETAFKVEAKRNRKSKFIIGLTTGTVTLALIGLVTYKLIK